MAASARAEPAEHAPLPAVGARRGKERLGLCGEKGKKGDKTRNRSGPGRSERRRESGAAVVSVGTDFGYGLGRRAAGADAGGKGLLAADSRFSGRLSSVNTPGTLGRGALTRHTQHGLWEAEGPATVRRVREAGPSSEHTRLRNPRVRPTLELEASSCSSTLSLLSHFLATCRYNDCVGGGQV